MALMRVFSSDNGSHKMINVCTGWLVSCLSKNVHIEAIDAVDALLNDSEYKLWLIYTFSLNSILNKQHSTYYLYQHYKKPNNISNVHFILTHRDV